MTMDALQVAARGAPASWVFVNEVQSAAGDIDAALADEDWATCVEACRSTLRAAAYTRLVLAGYRGRCPEGALDLRLALAGGPHSARQGGPDGALEGGPDGAPDGGPDGAGGGPEGRLLRELPPSWRADRAAAEAAAVRVRAAVAELERELPIQMPVIRTAEGFFPSVRIGADLERLRAQLGLPPIDWMTWVL
ncbi:MAG TPA: hypothetical protein VFB84_19185 [Micromonosporaceae bacterium]|nr:hypothetical protein [Micromonosporaceae bacterium]